MRKSMCLLLVLLLLTSCGIANKETSPSPQDKQSSKALSSQGIAEYGHCPKMVQPLNLHQRTDNLLTLRAKAMLHLRIILNS